MRAHDGPHNWYFIILHYIIGKSRGFGFVTMKDPDCVTAILEETQHILDGKTVKSQLNQNIRLIARRLFQNQPSRAILPKIWPNSKPRRFSLAGFLMLLQNVIFYSYNIILKIRANN